MARWLTSQGADHGIDPARSAVAGDLVGGNMTAAVLTLLAKERRDVSFTQQVLFRCGGHRNPVQRDHPRLRHAQRPLVHTGGPQGGRPGHRHAQAGPRHRCLTLRSPGAAAGRRAPGHAPVPEVRRAPVAGRRRGVDRSRPGVASPHSGPASGSGLRRCCDGVGWGIPTRGGAAR
ncbi:alpha/beta hydrolase fold domain-containing protein [Streptomyces sp. LN785]|uniref:alpha/beta hydrolase fold domain-containing protein n=1 Tax=Streptomyces sp. LN785 TaxID=3112983 RepID=UPI003723E965